MGYIYNMTNPSFEEYVKIGYAKDVKQRLDDLNRSSAVPRSTTCRTTGSAPAANSRRINSTRREHIKKRSPGPNSNKA